MAVVTEVLARISADPSRFVTGMRQAERAADSFGASVGGSPLEATNRLGGAMKMMAGVATAAYAAASGAVMKFGMQAIQASSAYEQQVISFEGIFKGVGRSAQDAKDYLSSLRDFAAKTPFEMPQLLDATKRLISLGYAAEDVRDRVMPAVGDIVAALGAPPDAINSVVYAFGQMKSAGRVMSQDLMQIGSALPGFNAKMAIANEMFGGNIDAMNKAIESGTLTSEKAIEAMLGAMQKFPGAAGAMERQSKSLNGVISTFKDNTRNALVDGLLPAIPLISGALSDLEPAVTGLAKSFSQSLGPAIADIVKNVGPSLTAFLQQAGPIVGDLLTSVGGLLVAVLPPLAAVLSLVTKVAASLFTQLGPAFQELVPAITALAEALGTSFITVIQALAPYVPQLATSFAQMVIAVTPLIPILAQMLTSFAPMIPALAILVELVARVSGAIISWTNNAGILVPILWAVVGAIVAMKVINGTLALMTAMSEGLLTMGVRAEATAAAEGRLTLAQKLRGAWTQLMTAAELAYNAVMNTSIALKLRSLAATVRETAAKVAGLVITKTVTAATWLWQAAQWALNIAMDANPIGIVILLIAGLVAIVVLIAKKFDWFRNILVAGWEAIKGAAVAVWNWLKQNWGTLLVILTGPIGLAVKFIIDHWQQILTFFKGLPAKFRSFATNMMQGLLNGIKKMGSAIWDAITGVVTKPIDWVKDKLGIHSPSKVTDAMGRSVGQGFANGMKSETDNVKAAAKGLKDAAVGGMTMDSHERRALATQVKAYQDFRAGERGDVGAWTGVTPKATEKSSTPAELTGLAKWRKELQTTVKLNESLVKLTSQGLPSQIIEDLRSKGEEGLKIANQLLNGGKKVMKDFIALYKSANALPKMTMAQRIGAFYQQEAERLKAVLADLKQAQADIRNDVAGMIRDQGLLSNLGLPTNYAASPEQLQYAMTSRVQAVQEFLDKMRALSGFVGNKKPLSGDLFRQILSMGPGAGTAMAEAFLTAGPDLMSAYKAGQSSISSMGTELANLGAASYNSDIRSASRAAATASTAANRAAVTNNVTLEVKGSVVTDKDLTKLIRDELGQLLRRKGVNVSGLGL